jgi:O-antigen/teichoic acid export membrane protein
VSSNQRLAGAALSLVMLLVNAALALFYVPLLLRFLTVSEYGIFELGSATIIFLSMMDFGLSAAVSRFYVRVEATNRGRLPDLIATSLLIYVFMTAVTVTLAFIVLASVDSLFGNSFSDEELSLTRQAMSLVLINCIFAIPATWLTGLITAKERFVFLRGLGLARSVLQFSLVALVLVVSSSVVLALAAQVFMTVVVFTVSLWYAFTQPGLEIKIGRWRWSHAKSLLGFSLLLAVIVAFDLVFWRTGQFIMGAVSGTAAIASYAIVSKLITSIFLPLSTSVSSVFLPRLTELDSLAGGSAEVNRLFIRIGRIQAILVWGVIGGFALFGKDLIQLWIGSEFSDVYSSALVLMFGLSISSTQSLGNSILQARNQLGFKAGLFAIMLLVFLGFSVPVAAHFEVLGLAVLGAVLLFLGTGPVMNVYYQRRIGLNIAAFFRATLPILFPVLASAAVVFGVRLFMQLPVSWLSLGLWSVVFVVLYGVLLWVVFLNQEEKTLVGVLARRVLR